MTNLDIILKSRDITLPTKVHLAMVFPVVMYGCESWTVKEAECQRINAFELWCWRRLLRVPWTARKSNQSILKEINPKYSLEGLMLKLQYFGYFMQGADSFEKTLILGKTEAKGEGGGRGWHGWMASLTQWAWIWTNSGRQWWTKESGMLQSTREQRVKHKLATKQKQQIYKLSLSHKWTIHFTCSHLIIVFISFDYSLDLIWLWFRVIHIRVTEMYFSFL